MSNTDFTVDLIAFHNDQVLLITRGDEPFKGRFALPGGYIDPGESARVAAIREAREETGLTTVFWEDLQFVGTFDEPGRDPRGHVVSTAYAVRLDQLAPVRAGDDAASAQWVPITEALRTPMAFDHHQILTSAHRLLSTGAL